jgi:hypothetical protein
MDHWQLAHLGMRQIPRELSEFELATFFTFSAKERALVDARRSHLYRLACAFHILLFCQNSASGVPRARLPPCRDPPTFPNQGKRPSQQVIDWIGVSVGHRPETRMDARGGYPGKLQ